MKARNHSRVSLPLARASRVRFVENEQRPTRKYLSLRKLAEASMDRKVLDLAQADEVAPGSIGGNSSRRKLGYINESPIDYRP